MGGSSYTNERRWSDLNHQIAHPYALALIISQLTHLPINNQITKWSKEQPTIKSFWFPLPRQQTSDEHTSYRCQYPSPYTNTDLHWRMHFVNQHLHGFVHGTLVLHAAARTAAPRRHVLPVLAIARRLNRHVGGARDVHGERGRIGTRRRGADVESCHRFTQSDCQTGR